MLFLIKRAVESPIMPKGYRKSDLKKHEVDAKGIPQDLAISNILASIYLSDFDKVRIRVASAIVTSASAPPRNKVVRLP